jgi:hypothetical protein
VKGNDGLWLMAFAKTTKEQQGLWFKDSSTSISCWGKTGHPEVKKK